MRALEDLQSIGRYTHNNWGKAQRNKYLRDMAQCFGWQSKRNGGKPRANVEDGDFSFPQGSNVIFHIIRVDTIDIIGIPHKNMDILNYFDTE